MLRKSGGSRRSVAVSHLGTCACATQRQSPHGEEYSVGRCGGAGLVVLADSERRGRSMTLAKPCVNLVWLGWFGLGFAASVRGERRGDAGDSGVVCHCVCLSSSVSSDGRAHLTR